MDTQSIKHAAGGLLRRWGWVIALSVLVLGGLAYGYHTRGSVGNQQAVSDPGGSVRQQEVARSPRDDDTRRPALLEERVRPAQPAVPRPSGPSAEDQQAYGTFQSACQEQARKRAEIHGVPVTPTITGNINGVANCHIPAMFTEKGAL